MNLTLVSLRPVLGAFSFEWVDAQALARRGADEQFSSYPVAGYGMIMPQDAATAFRGLVGWVRTGDRPIWPATP